MASIRKRGNSYRVTVSNGRDVSGRLGHAQTSTTMNIYNHQLKKKDEQAADTLENLFAHLK